MSANVYSTLQDLHSVRTDRRYRQALAVAREVLEWLEGQGVEAGVFGSLARGSFRSHSDVDFLVLDCPEGLRYRLEAGVEDRMGGLGWDVVYLDETREPFRSRALGELKRASSLC